MSAVRLDEKAIKAKLGPWVERPLKNISPELLPFWAGLKEHEFRLCTCRRCGAAYFPYTVCVNHADIPDFDEMVWTASAGRGKIFAKLVVHKVMDPDYAAEVPYVLALVEMDEGPLIPSRIVDCRPQDVKIGTAVEARYLDVPGAGHTLPFFVPAEPESR
jgi:uncharacterized OB-fold protein